MYPVLDHHVVSQQREQALHQTMCKLHRRPDKNLTVLNAATRSKMELRSKATWSLNFPGAITPK